MRFSGTVQPTLNTVSEFSKILAGGAPDRITADLSRVVTIKPYDTLCNMKKVDLIGDIALYYLTYVEDILEFNSNVRFICLKRDKNSTVDSWIRKTTIRRWRSKTITDFLYSIISRTPYYREFNFWQEHDRADIEKDPIWDKCFPKFKAKSKKEAIGMYWDYYYEEASRMADLHSENFRIVDLNELNTNQGQQNLLNFCGVPEEKHVYTKAHLHAIPG